MIRALRRDDGSTLLLTIFYAALSLALILVVVAATSLYLERKRLFTLADGASLVGAEAFSLDDVRPTASGVRPDLTSAEVAGAVNAFVADNPSDSFTGLKVVRAVSVDGRSATVELSCYWTPPVITLFVPRGIPIRVTSIARSVFSVGGRPGRPASTSRTIVNGWITTGSLFRSRRMRSSVGDWMP